MDFTGDLRADHTPELLQCSVKLRQDTWQNMLEKL